MRDQMSHYLRRILYGLALLMAGGFLHGVWTNLQRGESDLIPYSHMRPYARYINAVERQAKAAEIKSYMNENIDPCNNFYEFACGKWPRINKAHGNRVRTGSLERLSEALDRKVKKLLNREDPKLDTRQDKEVRSFYKSCVAVTSIDAGYKLKLQSLIKKFGSMPLLEGDKWQESNFDWLSTIANISFVYGFNIFWGTEVAKDIVNNKVNALFIVRQNFPLKTRSVYLDEHMEVYRQNYRDKIVYELKTFLSVEEKLALATATEILDLEVQLANGLVDMKDDVGTMELSKLTTLDEMQRIYAPTLDVKLLVDLSIGKKVEKVVDYNPQYKTNLVKVIQKTSKRILANYVFYKLISQFTLNVGETETEREKICLATTKHYLSKYLDNMVYRRNNNEATASDLELIWTELKQTFKQQLQSDSSLNWMSNRTRKLAIEKLAKMKFQVNSYADDDFPNMHLQDQHIIDNLNNIFTIRAQESRELLNQPAKPKDFGAALSFTPAIILMENVIKVPVALLQPYYFWASSYPNAIKFGALFAIIGHELIHGFDTQGRKFDALGNVNDWWDEESTTNFVNRQRCFTEQYSEHSYNGHNLPKTNDQSENIADNGGLRLAYTAYRRWQDAQNSLVYEADKEKLPTLNYTSNQLFFISYAQFWCNDVQPDYRKYGVASDDHLPGQFRVIVPLANFDEFAKEFQCELDTPMNPVRKCKLY